MSSIPAALSRPNSPLNRVFNTATDHAVTHQAYAGVRAILRQVAYNKTISTSSTACTISYVLFRITIFNREISRVMASTTGNVSKCAEDVYESVKNYYGKVLSKSSDLLTDACCTSGRPPQQVVDALKKVPQEISDKYYGCGTPLPFGIRGLKVLDLGSGSGRDCYVAAALTGPDGVVTGIDMTEEQLSVARAHVDAYTETLAYPKPNLRFIHGYMEFLEDAGIQPGSMDLVISNCVINLSPNKERVLAEVYKSLRIGGEFYFSDVYCSRRLPETVRTHDTLLGECLGGALYTEDFKRICAKVGFTDPRQLAASPIAVRDPALQELLGEARFQSVTFRCFKLPATLESPPCEDYGQVAVYRGGIPGHAHSYRLDGEHVLETGRPLRVCGNTASMLADSWLSQYFLITGDRQRHYGMFHCRKPDNLNTGSPCC